MQHFKLRSFPVIFLVISCFISSPKLISAQQLDDLSKGIANTFGAISKGIGDAFTCSKKLEDTDCYTQLKGISAASGDLSNPSTGHTQEICCSMKAFSKCSYEKLGNDEQCKGWLGGMDKKYDENCSAHRKVCGAGAALVASTTTIAVFLFLFTLLFPQLVSV